MKFLMDYVFSANIRQRLQTLARISGRFQQNSISEPCFELILRVNFDSDKCKAENKLSQVALSISAIF